MVAADRPQRRSQQQLQTQADLERQQILQDMKKKTQLLTDNSWIRQQSTSMAPSKEPVDVPMRRYPQLAGGALTCRPAAGDIHRVNT